LSFGLKRFAVSRDQVTRSPFTAVAIVPALCYCVVRVPGLKQQQGFGLK